MGRAKKQSSRELPEAITPLLEPLAALQRVLERYENRGLIIGGIAASLLGRPRLTADLKAIAHRSKDLSDISSITAVHPNLDREHIRYWVEQFGEVLENPGLWKEVENLL